MLRSLTNLIHRLSGDRTPVADRPAPTVPGGGEPDTSAKSIIVYTLHKSASMFLHRQAEHLSGLANLVHYSPNASKGSVSAKAMLTDPELWTPRGACYCPVRFWVDVPDLDAYEVLLHLRDPRDVLVSMFFSYCYIHPGEIEADTGYRREVAARGIDRFVLDKASDKSAEYRGSYGTGRHLERHVGTVPQRYRDYIDNLLGRPNVTLLRYEEMVTDYESWLRKFIRPFPLDDPEAVIAALVAEQDTLIPERKEDVMEHIRHVTPGDHKLKLKPETIDELNEIFGDTLRDLGYPLHD